VLRRLFLLATALVAIAPPMFSQSSCDPRPGDVVSAGKWLAPLDRAVSLRARDVSLREALDRLTVAANVDLSYSAELVPLDKRVCAAFEKVALGDALAVLLAGTGVGPVPVGVGHVALTPARPAPALAEQPRPASVLDRVVITGSTIGAPERPLTVAMNVVNGSRLARHSQGNLSETLDDGVPGVWLWAESPTALLAHYGSIRGASSFGSSYPKVYVDGIEIANPLLITQFTPETVDRIEVIRGPQGAALYGSDAISGVINVVTRHDGSNRGTPNASVRSDMGAAATNYASSAALLQEHGLTVRDGSSARSGEISITSGGVGAYLPGAYAHLLTGDAGARFVGSKSIVSVTGRLFSNRAVNPLSPLYSDSLSRARAKILRQESVREYTLGATGTLMQNEHWTHTVIAGIDGDRLANLEDEYTPLPSTAGPDLGTVNGSANLASLRASSVAKIGNQSRGAATFTFGFENALLSYSATPDTTFKLAGGVTPAALSARRLTTAGVAQTNLSWKDNAYLTGGIRLERNAILGSSSTVSLLPMLGAAVVRDYGPMTLKFRSAYGKGIRPATTAARETSWLGVRDRSPQINLSPEEQSGLESGVDVFFTRAFSLQATRFDQLASGLIQRVAMVSATNAPPPPPGGSGGPVRPQDRRIAYALQNVGEISNRGWELAGTVSMSKLSVAGTFTEVESRVQKVAATYTGDLRAGDRMLEVPKFTTGVTATWTSALWSSSLTASRASNWVNYDRIALAAAFSNSVHTDAELVGAQLRNYWLQYNGVTRLRATISRNLTPGLSVLLSGDNLMNQQHGEPDNVTIVPGRSLTFGLKAGF
jgi:Outer membrane receptor for ferrienterochelin and colicins